MIVDTRGVSPPADKPFRILSLDGGGAKGFYTLGVLHEIESLVEKPLSSCFDLIFGTSTGAIIGALLARGDRVSAILQTYQKHVPTIMKPRFTPTRTKALRSLARSVFGDDRLESFKTLVGIVATNWVDEKPFIFKTSVNLAHASKGSFQPFFGISVADAIISSCSAYPFFSPHTVKKGNGDTVDLADGGFCANNPTLYAIADATSALGIARRDLRIVNVGVGSYPRPSFLRRNLRHVMDAPLLRHVPNSDFLQRVLDTNARSMEILGKLLFKDVSILRISETFSEPHLATDLLEHNLRKLDQLTQKGRQSFGEYEGQLKEYLLG